MIYKNIYGQLVVTNIADLTNAESGKTYREENMEKIHKFPIGSLVEYNDNGIRLFVVYHYRDCDGTPLYALGFRPDDIIQHRKGFTNDNWDNGYPETSLKLVEKE